MKNMLVLVGVGLVSFLLAFAFAAREEIGDEVGKRLDEDFIPQCVARAQFPAELAPHAEQICGCMKREFDTRGLELTDAFGSHRAEMQRITQVCAARYS